MGKQKVNQETRRTFLKKSCIASVGIAGADFINPYFHQGTELNQGDQLPWYSRITRWGQTNITETDPPTYDVKWWREYWKRTSVQGIIVNAGGIVAYYPSKVPLHRQAHYLGGRDLFGELCKSAHEDGLAVFARMDSNRAHEEFYNAHPGWFAVNASGKPFKAGELFITCINSPYYEIHIPQIITEIARLYHPEGFTDNSWSGLGRESICYCDNCRNKFRDKYGLDLPVKVDWNDKIYRQWIKWSYERRIEIWELNNRTSRSAGGDYCIWAGMNSGSISGQCQSFRDYREICKRAAIIMLDSQARNDAEGFQQNSITGKLIHGLLGWDKLIPESMAMYQAGRPTFRLSAKPANEARMWMYEGIAGGIQPWWHHVGAYHEDRRMYKTAEPVMAWHRANEEFLISRQPVSTVGVVWSQLNMDFFGRDRGEYLAELPWRGITQALIRSRIPFTPIHADDIERDADRSSLLVLPNLGSMSDDQVMSVRKFVEKGGSLFATGVTSLYDEWGEQRNDFALSDILGAHLPDDVEEFNKQNSAIQSTEVLHTYLRLHPELRRNNDGPHNDSEPPLGGKRNAVLKGFELTDILPFGGSISRLITDKDREIPLTFIPAFPIYPPETAWMRIPKTGIPGLLLKTLPGGAKIAFMPADIDRQYARFNLPDHGALLQNIFMWALNDKLPLVIEGKGLIDCNLYRQKSRLILHIVNLTNMAAWRQPMEELIPAGPFKIKIFIPEKGPSCNVKFLVSGSDIKTAVNSNWCEFVINEIRDHEVVVLI